jgi:hypothetical protein
MLPATELRNGTLPDLVDLLKLQSDVKWDRVVSASRLSYRDGLLAVSGGAQRLDLDGVSDCDALLAPTEVFEDGISDKLGIPRAYIRKLRETGRSVELDAPWVVIDVSLIDANVNGWLQSDPGRKFLIRGFRTDDPDEVGIGRAFLSNAYAPYDNYDGILAVLDGVRESGVNVQIHSANLSERTCRLSVYSPEIAALAPTLLANYRSPFTPGKDRGHGTVGEQKLPIVFAGFEFRNSETGGGKFKVVPRIVVEKCGNGMTKTVDAKEKTHLGQRLEEGAVKWSEDTRKKNLAVLAAMTRDAVKSFLSADYLASFVSQVEETSATPIDDAVGTIEHVAKVHAFSEGEAQSILACFIKSGDLTAGGVMQAVTAAAQTVESPDRAAELEDAALGVLATAAA